MYFCMKKYFLYENMYFLYEEFCKTVPCVAIWLKLDEKERSMVAEPGSS